MNREMEIMLQKMEARREYLTKEIEQLNKVEVGNQGPCGYGFDIGRRYALREELTYLNGYLETLRKFKEER
ncbi:MAG: hypothetical protein Q4B26_04735 [Eubacteriales bacterium]|nr:hypothetical protein [Eubacteriales bacterium]